MTDVTENGFVLTAEDLEDISDEDLDELEEIADELIESITQFQEEVDDGLDRVNNSEVYKKLGKELHIEFEYQFLIGEREE